MSGLEVDSGDGTPVAAVPMTDEEVLHHGAEIALLRDLYRAR
jgi:hypothetical protein